MRLEDMPIPNRIITERKVKSRKMVGEKAEVVQFADNMNKMYSSAYRDTGGNQVKYNARPDPENKGKWVCIECRVILIDGKGNEIKIRGGKDNAGQDE